MLPQVLAGLGVFSLLSAGCLFWLERLQPLFFAVAAGALLYQVWLVRCRPRALAGWGAKMILAVSLLLNTTLIGGWIVISIRYQ